MASLSEELLTVLREAEKAQQLEQEMDHIQAIDSFYMAACQLSYLIDLHMEKGSSLEHVCKHLVGMYQHHILMLRSKVAAAGEAHWVQLEDVTAAKGEPCHHSMSLNVVSVPVRQTTGQLSVSIPCLERTDAPAVLQAAAVGMASMPDHCSHPTTVAFGPGSESEGSVMPTAQAESQRALSFLHLCQRPVSGSLDDVVGLEDVKTELEEAIFLPLEYPYLFKGIRQPARTFLLYGPPGTGKTMLVEKLAAEANCTLLSLSPSVILSKWSGDSEKAISLVFDLARTMQPAVLFLDEVDSIGQSRRSDTDAGSRRMLTELLIQFNRVADDEGVYVFAATNRMQDCDPALLRRFSRRIEVPLPSTQDHLAFLQSVLRRPEVESCVSQEEMQRIAELTSGFSGSDLAALCQLAVMAPVRELLTQKAGQKRSCKRRRLAAAGQVSMITSPQHIRDTMTEDGQTHVVHRMQPMCAESSLDPAQQQQQQQSEESRMGLQSEANRPSIQTSLVAGDHDVCSYSKKLQVRQLVLDDFVTALQKIRPAAVDALEPDR